MHSINVGDTVVCAETGKTFTVAQTGCSYNYARSAKGEVLSDEGVDIREKRGLLDRSKPFYCYVSGNGCHVTGWKGNILGDIIQYAESPSGWHGSTIARFRVRDVHGRLWSGRGEGRGMYCTLRAMKG